MEIIWFEDAKEHLNLIYKFYLRKNPDAAIRIHNQILDEIDILKNFPKIGQIESLLSNYALEFRCLVVEKGKFKVIYEVDNQSIYIYAIWDCRQDPDILVGDLFG